MTRRAAAVALAGVLLAACGGASAGEKALDETEDRLDRIRSGTLSLLLLASPVSGREGEGAGFQVEGPFAVGEKEGSLPVADLRYTRITGSQRRTTRFVSTGSRAFVEVDGRVTELDAAQVADLRVRDEGSSGGLDGLSLGAWLDEPTVAPGPAIDGAAADVVTGKDDRLLRRADVSVDLAVVDDRVREALGDLAGARLAMGLEVRDLNRPVEVSAPQPAGGRR